MQGKLFKRIIIPVVAMVLCAVVIVIVCVVFAGGDGISHIVVEDGTFGGEGGGEIVGELRPRLVREKLETTTLDGRGFMQDKTDENLKDFSDLNENIFGIDDDVLVGPGCMFKAYMSISNAANADFEYWLEIVPVGGGTLFTEQLRLTVTADGRTVIDRSLAGGLTTEPIAQVLGEDVSKFEVTLEYTDLPDNDKTQNMTLVFDMVVHARLIAAN